MFVCPPLQLDNIFLSGIVRCLLLRVRVFLKHLSRPFVIVRWEVPVKKVAVVIGVMAVVGVAGIAVARASYSRFAGCHRGPFGFMSRRLNLTDNQKAQVKSIWQAERPTVSLLLRDLANEQTAMNTATAQGNFDAAKVQLIASSQAATISKLLVEKEKIINQIYTGVLTPEQRIKADQWKAKWPERLNKMADRIANGSNEAPDNSH